MLERFLGPRLDHADPQVRAKGYALAEVDLSQVNAALATEEHPDVLAVIIGRANEVRSLLHHVANSHSTLANAARTRILQLADNSSDDQAAQATAADWHAVFDQAMSEKWSQRDALIEQIGRRNVAAALLDGALSNQAKHKLISEPVLQNLAVSSESAASRLAAACALQSEEALQACAQASMDKDKSVYREVRTRLDQMAARRARSERAVSLNQSLQTLAQQEISANTESLTGLQAKWQQLNKEISELVEQADGEVDDNLEQLQQRHAQLAQTIEQKVQGARHTVIARRDLLEETNKLLATEVLDASAIDGLEQRWKALPDHSETENTTFANQCKALKEKQALQSQQQERIHRAKTLIETWQNNSASQDPDRALVKFEKAWNQLTMPDDATSRDELAAQSAGVLSKLRDAAEKLSRKREKNDAHLRELRDQFKQSIDNGDLKLATSLHDKIRSRLSNQALNDAARKDVESTVREAQPKLDEYRKWRHFGTNQARENLLGEANGLLSDPPNSPKELASKIKALREAWRKLDQDDGRASEAQWESFNSVCKEAYKPAKQHFNNLSKERKSNFRDKQQIIDALNELHKTTDWDAPDWGAVTQALKEEQQKWQRSGAVDFKLRKTVERDYQLAIDQIEEHLKGERSTEVERRQRLIAQVRQTFENDSIDQAVRVAKTAQRQWKPTVQGDRKLEQSLWEEFRSVCDEVFGKLKETTKEAKAAWQAEAKEREGWIEQLDALLKSEADPVANAASGQAEELAKQWRQRSQIPKPVMLKLDRRFQAARKAFDQRLKRLRATEASKQEAQLNDLLELCQNIETALFTDSSADEWQAKLDEFDDARGSLAKHLRKRYEYALQGLQGDSAVKTDVQSQHESALESREALCLRGELVAQIDSPADKQEQRKQLQLERLRMSLQGGGKDTAIELAEIHDQWFQLAGVSASEWPDLRQRFAAIQSSVKN